MKSINEMPQSARTWVYQSNRELSESEVKEIIEKGRLFSDTWAAHGSELDSCIDLLENRFLVIMVDEEQANATGCSIDKSVHFVQELEGLYNISLTDRLDIAFKNGSGIKTARLSQIKEKIGTGEISAETLVYNNSVSTKAEFTKSWEGPLKDSWLNKYLEQD